MFYWSKNHTLSLSMVLPKVPLSLLSTGLSYYELCHDSDPTSSFKPLWNYPLYTSWGLFLFCFVFCFLTMIWTNTSCIYSACDIFCLAKVNKCYGLSTWNASEMVRNKIWGDLMYLNFVWLLLKDCHRFEDMKSSWKDILKSSLKTEGSCVGHSCAYQSPKRKHVVPRAPKASNHLSVPVGFVQLQRAA